MAATAGHARRLSGEGAPRAREVKVVLLGDTGVGKSSLVLRFVTNNFKPYSESTIGCVRKRVCLCVITRAIAWTGPLNLQPPAPSHTWHGRASFMSKMLLVEDTPMKFQIWDTAGQEKYHSLAPMYYKCVGALSCGGLVWLGLVWSGGGWTDGSAAGLN